MIAAFEQRLKTIAEQIASDAGSKKIVEPHIRQAYDTLRRCGIDGRKQLPWYFRKETKITVGSFLVGLSPTIASVAKDCIEANNQLLRDHPIDMWVWMISIPFVTFGAGAFLLGWGITNNE